MPPARILVLSFSPIASDPRVRRQIDLLKAEYRLTVAGYGSFDSPGLEFIPLTHVHRSPGQRLHAAVRLKLRRFDAHYWSTPAVVQADAALRGQRYDLILANDSDAWPLAHALAAAYGTPVLCDAHEYTPREFEDLAWWRFLFQTYKTTLCQRYLPTSAGVLTVCEGIADEYARVLGIPRPSVVMNTPPAQSLVPGPTHSDRVRMVHHGGATRSRRIETMIRMVGLLDARFTLDLILVPTDPAYLDELRSLAHHQPRVRFLEPVPMPEIPARLNTYDVGLYLLEPNSFNNRHALPNKFFEFIQARLAVAIGPSPEMARLVRTHQLGIVADDFSPQALAAGLNSLDHIQIDAFKANAHRAAQILSWEHEREILDQEVKRLLAHRSCVA